MNCYSHRLSAEVQRQGSANKIYTALKKQAEELANEQAEIILSNKVKSKGPAFQRRLRKFFKRVPPRFMDRILAHYSKVFQRQASKAAVS